MTTRNSLAGGPMKSRRRAAKIAALVIYIIVVLVATPQAQQPVAFAGAPGGITAGPSATSPDATMVDLLVGRSTIVNVGSAIARVSLTVPDVADAMVTAPQQLLIHGKPPGRGCASRCAPPARAACPNRARQRPLASGP